MAPKKKTTAKGGAVARSCVAALILPTLAKTSYAVEKYISTPGKFWDKCPAADKDKRSSCVPCDRVHT